MNWSDDNDRNNPHHSVGREEDDITKQKPPPFIQPRITVSAELIRDDKMLSGTVTVKKKT